MCRLAGRYEEALADFLLPLPQREKGSKKRRDFSPFSHLGRGNVDEGIGVNLSSRRLKLTLDKLSSASLGLKRRARILKPAQAGFVCIAAVSTAQRLRDKA
jgi:hypothetical protein